MRIPANLDLVRHRPWKMDVRCEVNPYCVVFQTLTRGALLTFWHVHISILQPSSNPKLHHWMGLLGVSFKVFVLRIDSDRPNRWKLLTNTRTSEKRHTCLRFPDNQVSSIQIIRYLRMYICDNFTSYSIRPFAVHQRALHVRQ